MQPRAHGQCVKHLQYGLGEVTQSDAERTSIEFHLHGPKKFATKMVVELTDEVLPAKPQPARRRKGPRQIPPFTISIIGK
jgi:hypothetical protein